MTLDFYQICVEEQANNRWKNTVTVRPEFLYGRTKDLVCKGGDFYAFWDGETWVTELNSLIQHVDDELALASKEAKEKSEGKVINTKYFRRHSSNVMNEFQKYTGNSTQSNALFNGRIFFADEHTKREDYSTAKLPYSPVEGDAPAFRELLYTLYHDSEATKILWFMGALLTNNMYNIQKFMFLYGGKGTGKGTILKIFKKVFEGYWAPIDLAHLTGTSEFATSGIKEIPLLIDDDCDISKIHNDAHLLKLTGHEPLTVNNKYSKMYEVEFTGLLVAASNQRFKVRNIDSGITRRAVTVEPSGDKLKPVKYREIMKKIDFELPYIANMAIEMFNSLGPDYYEDYIDVAMMENTDHFYAFVKDNAKLLGDRVTLVRAAELYKAYLDDIGYDTKGYKLKCKQELMRYYKEFHNRKKIDGNSLYNVYIDLKWDVLFPEDVEVDYDEVETSLAMNSSESYFDHYAKDYQAQYTTKDGTPKKKWVDVTSVLSDIDTTKLHFVRLPLNHIVVDFDLKGPDGEKSLELNRKAASTFPKTYAEVSKSGNGLHLHYIWDGNPSELSSLYSEGIEVKVFTGASSLRRKFTLSNGYDEITHISAGLPLKKEVKKMLERVDDIVWTEKKLRTIITRNLRKEYHDHTRPSVDFIVKVLTEAKEAGVKYDVEDLREDIYIFAERSSNQAKYCMDAVRNLTYSTIEDDQEFIDTVQSRSTGVVPDEELYFYDVEVFPNVLIVCYKRFGDPTIHKMINPSPEEIEWLLRKPLVGYNNTRYDNHILYCAMLSNTNNTHIYQTSQRIVTGNGKAGLFGPAYELSYMDLYEVTTNKQSLKKWEIQLGLKHDEFEHPWDQPLDESLWDRAAEYCGNDVYATEEVFKAIKADYIARQILADMSGLSINTKTQRHAAKILFGEDKRPQDKFVYTDLSTIFPGYKYEFGKSEFMGEDPSEGGYVYSEPGVYQNVGVFDVASMHPTSAIELNYFGPYTKNYKDILDTRLHIKHMELDVVKTLLGGKLKKYVEMVENRDITAKDLSYALKIVVNIVYGMSSAKFDNPFRHPDNVDNIIAKRGALFMILAKHKIQELGYTVAHIKTDSIKVPNVDDKVTKFIFDLGEQYGYKFEMEHIYESMALVNKSTLIAKYQEDGETVWEAVGAQFAEPYVYKTLFTKEPLEAKDLFITKQVKSKMYLGDEFIGKVGLFYPSKTGYELLKEQERKGEIKLDAVTGTKGYLWRKASDFTDQYDIDMEYYTALCIEAIEDIKKVGNIDLLIDSVPQSFDVPILK